MRRSRSAVTVVVAAVLSATTCAASEITLVSAEMSSDYGGQCTADKCIDGDNTTETICGDGATTMCHTQWPGETDPWLSVDMGGEHTLQTVTIYNRLDCCQEIGPGVVSEPWGYREAEQSS